MKFVINNLFCSKELFSWIYHLIGTKLHWKRALVRKSKTNKPNTTFTYSVLITGLPQLIYSIGVYRFPPSKAYLIKLTNDENRLGFRPSRPSEIIFSQICRYLNIEFECVGLSELKKIPIAEHDVVDIQLINRVLLTSARRPVVLAAQSEFVNLMRPKIISLKWQSFKLRIDLTKSFLLPSHITEFYTLARKPKKGLFLTERTLDWASIDLFSMNCLNAIIDNPELKFLSSLRAESNDLHTLIVFPLAAHFGGNPQINIEIIESAITHAQKNNIHLIIVKNHPSDSENYSGLITSQNYQIRYLCTEFERTLPVEILVNLFQSVSFFGFESTTFLTLQHRVTLNTHVVDIGNHSSKKLRKYLLGEIRTLYPHTKTLIKY